jgi:hypothetical protein
MRRPSMRGTGRPRLGRKPIGPGIAPVLAAWLLILTAGAATPAGAHSLARLSGGVDVACDASSAETRVEVRNSGAQPVILTHALFYFQTHIAGESSWRPATVSNLLEEGDGTFDHVLSPGEQKGSASIFDFAPTENVAHVRGVLLVHVLGEPFWRVALDVDACR